MHRGCRLIVLKMVVKTGTLRCLRSRRRRMRAGIAAIGTRPSASASDPAAWCNSANSPPSTSVIPLVSRPSAPSTRNGASPVREKGRRLPRAHPCGSSAHQRSHRPRVLLQRLRYAWGELEPEISSRRSRIGTIGYPRSWPTRQGHETVALAFAKARESPDVCC